MKKIYFYNKNIVLLSSLCLVNTAFAAGSQSETLETVTVTRSVIDTSGTDLIGGSSAHFSNNNLSLNNTLKNQRAASLGQTIEKVSGVQNNSFGPNNGIPQIRSLTNFRVQVNDNGLGVSSLSAISGHLPTAIQPAFAESIDVYKSSAAVLYGGNAIGGAVNVNTSQIPDSLPDKKFSGKVEISGGKNTTFDQLFSLNGKAGQIAWHIDGMNSRISDYDIGSDNSKSSVCYNKDNLWRMGKNGMGINTSLERACQMSVNTDKDFNPNYYQFIKKDFFEALQAGEDAMQQYKDKYGLDAFDQEYIDASTLKWGSPFLQYKNKNQFKQLSPEQQKMVIEEKWGGYIVPNFNKLVANPNYKAGEEKEKTYLKDIKDIIETPKGKIPNSHMHNQNFSTGVSFIGSKGYIGIGASHYKNDYGVPGYASLYSKTDLKKVNLSPVNIESKQIKLSLHGAYTPTTKYIDNIKGQLTYLNADNAEYLGDTFADSLNAKQTQAHIEMNHHLNNFTQGAIGLDISQRKTDGEGKDRFLPNTKSKQFGLFAMQNFSWDKVQATIGYRYEKTKHKALFNDDYETTQKQAIEKKYSKRSADFNQQDYFIDLNWQPAQFITLNTRYSHSERAPEVNELFASNFHFATLTDEQGDPSLKKEKANTWEIGTELSWKNTTFGVNYFNTDYQDYIYLANTGISRFGLEVKEWRQADTLINGWELELNQQLDFKEYGDWDIRLFADLVKNKPADKNDMRYRRDGAYMPNMPTSRYGIGISWNKDNWQAGTTLTHYRTQKYGTNNGWEVDLPNYNVLDAYVGYTSKPSIGGQLEWFLDARNLTDTKAHANNSSLKYLTPIAGRSLRTGLRYSF